MRRRLSFPSRVRSGLPVVGFILAFSVVPIGLVLLLHFWKGFSINMLIRDPVAYLRSPFYVGFYSQIGILLWAAAAAVCILSGVIFSKLGKTQLRNFFFASGLLTILLGMDDAFMLHEQALPRVMGIPEEVIYACYFGFMAVYLVVYASKILETDYLPFVLALTFFGISIGVDCLGFEGEYWNFVEDGPKMIGIVSWLTYFFRTAAAMLPGAAAQDKAAA